MRVVITEFMAEAAVASLAEKHDIRYEKDLVDRPDDLTEAIADADALIVRNKTRVDAKLLAEASKLLVIGRLGVGLDNIDVKACKARGVEVIAASGANAQSVAEYAICAAMILLRGAYHATPAVAAGKWPRSAMGNGHEIAGKTLGLIGFGSTGRCVATLARGLGMRVMGFDAHIGADSPLWAEHQVEARRFAEVFVTADVVTLHVPLTLATHNLVDAALIATMKETAILINTARGGVVDERAVAAALTSGKLAGAAFDVFESEPLPAGSKLADCPNVLLTPHIAGLTRESNLRVSTLISDKILAALARHAS